MKGCHLSHYIVFNDLMSVVLSLSVLSYLLIQFLKLNQSEIETFGSLPFSLVCFLAAQMSQNAKEKKKLDEGCVGLTAHSLVKNITTEKCK